MGIGKLDAQDQWEKIRARSETEPVVLFKHSIACSLSATARRQMQQLQAAGDAPVYELVVQESRALSGKIASDLGIRHETPQVIVLFKGQPVFHGSHRQVTVEIVRGALAAARHTEAAYCWVEDDLKRERGMGS